MRLQGKKEYSLWSIYPELFVNNVKKIGGFNEIYIQNIYKLNIPVKYPYLFRIN